MLSPNKSFRISSQKTSSRGHGIQRFIGFQKQLFFCIRRTRLLKNSHVYDMTYDIPFNAAECGIDIYF